MASAAKGQNFGSAAYNKYEPGSGGSGGNGGNGGTTKKKSSSSSGNSGSKSSKSKDPWYKSLSRVYNLEQKINAELRKREKLEKQFDRLLKGWGITAREIASNLNKQLKQIKATITDSRKIIANVPKLMKDARKAAIRENKLEKKDKKTNKRTVVTNAQLKK